MVSFSFLGHEVVRAIPDSVKLGLATGAYTLHGGVIRWATGTPQGGQIVAHLLPAVLRAGGEAAGTSLFPPVAIATKVAKIALGSSTGLMQTGILMDQMSVLLQAVKGLSIIAGLNLAVSAIGFTVLYRRLGKVEEQLTTIASSIAGIERLLRHGRRAELRVALEHMMRIDLITNVDVRRELLVQSATSLGTIALLFEQQFGEAESIAEAMAYEEYFWIAMLAQVRCYAELREPGMALASLETHYGQWHTAIQPLLHNELLGKYPEKFLTSQYAEDVSIAELSHWLDMAHGTHKGLAWIDELRTKVDPWYFYRELAVQPETRRYSRSADFQQMVTTHKERIIPAIRKLVARYDMLPSYMAQYQLMADNRLTPGEFEAKLAELPEETRVDDFVLLLPWKEQTLVKT